VVALLDDGGGSSGGASGSGDESAADSVELAPAGELPSSNADVLLGSLNGGADRRLGELFGAQPVVINFFASWCVPCIDEMPAFERVHQEVGDRVTFIGMANRDAPEDALATVEATGVTYPTFDDPDASALTWFGGLVMPTTVFIDASGEVVDRSNGALDEAELRAKLADLFGVAA
jgi:cytochrome c biogenesis protein CcmG, thiol:disulfide interchange protein DsbE